jgi:thioredoxin 1
MPHINVNSTRKKMRYDAHLIWSQFIMLNRREILAIAALAFIPTAARAANLEMFTDAAFKQAQKDGKSILIDIAADWCPTCKAQAPIIDSLLASPKFKNLVSFRVDFDGQVDVVRAMGAQSQSTLIAFKGANEISRSVGDTEPASIEALLAAAI